MVYWHTYYCLFLSAVVLERQIRFHCRTFGMKRKLPITEYRSFKEQGIDREPTIHIGVVANALERKGIQTIRSIRTAYRSTPN